MYEFWRGRVRESLENALKKHEAITQNEKALLQRTENVYWISRAVRYYFFARLHRNYTKLKRARHQNA